MSVLAATTARRARVKGHSRAIPNRECFLVNLRDGLRCHACGRHPRTRDRYHRGFEYHHLVPVRDGGEGLAENIVLLCKVCHRLADSGALPLEPDSLALPGERNCAACGAAFDPRTVEMNCGWYRCDACGEQCHLFDHFGYGKT